jgi:putative peptide zinc metalloprotease protein
MTRKAKPDLKFQVRPDVVWIPYPDSARWVAQDPISSTFFYFSELEYSTARLLDGKKSLPEVVGLINRLAIREPISLAWIEQFIFRLSKSNLLHPACIPSGARSFSRSHAPSKSIRSWFSQALRNPLALRMPLIRISHHSALSKFLAAVWFHRWTATVGAMLMAVTGLLVVSDFVHRPERIFYDVQRLQGERWFALIGIIFVVKSLHELGHYLACVRWKADCHELGIMFLCFAPCFYCDTTNAWKLPSKWKRAAIASGGIYFELWVAALAGIVLINTQPGLWHTLAAGTWLMCTLGTLLVNGNPCFRYDGYYILSDLWNVPNLASQSSQALWGLFVQALGGRKPTAHYFDKGVGFLAVFAFVSGVYRIGVIFFLFVLVWGLLVPKGLGVLALLILGSMGLGLLAMVYQFSWSLVAEFFTSKPIRTIRFVAFWGVVAAILVAAFMVPIPQWLLSRGYVELKSKGPVYVQENSALAKIGSLDGRLSSGELLFESVNPEKQLEQLKVVHEIEELTLKIETLEQSKVDNEGSAYELPTLQELRNELYGRKKVLDSELDALRQLAPRDGWFYPSLYPLPSLISDEIGKPRFAHLLDSENLGMSLERGALVGWFTPSLDRIIHGVVEEHQARWIRVGASASVALDASPGKIIECRILRIGTEPISEFPLELLGDPGMIAIRDEYGKLVSETPHYLVVLEPTRPLIGNARAARASIRFQLPGKSLVESGYEFLLDRFRID